MNKKILSLAVSLFLGISLSVSAAGCGNPHYIPGNWSDCIANSCGTTQGEQVASCVKIDSCGQNSGGCRAGLGNIQRDCVAVLIPCPVPVNGGWSSWSDWSACDNTDCGKVCTQTQTRVCNNPIPANGGLNCSGDATQTKTTQNPACESAGTCPVSCGYAGGTVPDGNGGLTSCNATEACAAAQECPTDCGYAGGAVPNGQGGEIQCGATEACQVVTTEPAAPIAAATLTSAETSSNHSSGGQYIWQTNPAMWLKIQIDFIKDKIERLQAQLNALLGI